MAVAGHVDAISRAEVSGWAADPDDLSTAAEIAIIVNGEQRAIVRATEPRPGLAAESKGAASDNCGFSHRIDPPLSVFHEWRFEVVDAASRQPLRAGVHTLPAPSRDGTASLAPLVITSPGRAGTTRLMAELARSPGVVVAEAYPYEIKQIAYYASVFRVLTAPADRTRSAHPETMLAPEQLHLAGSNPFYEPGFFGLARPRAVMRNYYESRVPAQYASLFRALILEFYDILRVSQGKPAASFFCEKGDIDDAARQAARLFFPQVRELVVVRDPRDLLASAIAFWKGDPEERLAMLKATLPPLAAIHRQRAPDRLTLRYEDLVQDSAGTLRAIEAFVGAPLDHASPPPNDAAMAAHRTSRDELSSVGRWKTDLPPALAAACEAAFSDYMALFDYRPSQPVTALPATALPASASPPAPPDAVAIAVAATAAPPPVAAAPPPPAVPWAARPGVVLVARGQPEVARLHEAGQAMQVTDLDGGPWRPVTLLNFGADQPELAQLGPGWSKPEPGFVWSSARQCHLALTSPREPGNYRVWIAGAPMLHPESLPEQAVTVLVNAVEAGQIKLSAPSVLAFDLPAAAMAAGGRIAVTLRLPFAARPVDLGSGADDRLLGFSLRWVMVLRHGRAAAALAAD
jgi:Sulfotransferase family